MADKPSRAIRSAERLREKVSITHVLAEYGYDVRVDGGDREQQFPCNLHGNGQDNKPSARVYPDNTFYCFACDLTRDVIAVVRANDGLSFWDAVRKLERAYNLPALPWEDDESEEAREPSTQSVIEANLKPGRTFDDDVKRFLALLDGGVQNREVSLTIATSFWEAFDKLSLNVKGFRGKGGPWKETKGRLVLEQLRKRLLEAL